VDAHPQELQSLRPREDQLAPATATATATAKAAGGAGLPRAPGLGRPSRQAVLVGAQHAVPPPPGATAALRGPAPARLAPRCPLPMGAGARKSAAVAVLPSPWGGAGGGAPAKAPPPRGSRRAAPSPWGRGLANPLPWRFSPPLGEGPGAGLLLWPFSPPLGEGPGVGLPRPRAPPVSNPRGRGRINGLRGQAPSFPRGGRPVPWHP
jgi:hypothetical protein